MSATPWTTLGIQATRDKSIIKRAYAERLKEIDPDVDPLHFQELRDARDRAIALARSEAFDAARDAETLARHSSGEEAQFREQESVADHIDDPALTELQDHHQALCEILFQTEGNQFYAATADEESAMLRHFEAIVANPNLQSVGNLANASEWFANAIARMIPRSDVLVGPAVRAFGWTSADEVRSDPAVAFVVRRHLDLRFAAELDEPSHKFHRAWKELRTPAAENSSRGWVSTNKVDGLLQEIREKHPNLEGALDWYRVEMWERRESRLSVSNSIPKIVLVFVLFSSLLSLFASEESAETTPQAPSLMLPDSRLTTSAEDIDTLARSMTADKLSGSRLAAANPKLYGLLQTNWEEAYSRGLSKEFYLQEARALVAGRLDEVLDYASDDLLVKQFTLKRDVAQHLGSISAAMCASFLDGGSPQLTDSLRGRADDLRVAKILELDPTRSLIDRKTSAVHFVIPSAVGEDIALRLGKPADVASNSIRGNLGPKPYCEAQIALYSTVLELPGAQRLRILQDMASD